MDFAAPTTSIRTLRSVTITLPLPRRELSPNSRCHWRAKARIVKQSRTTAREMVQLSTHAPPPYTAACCEPRFFFANNRKRDRDNLLASLKPSFDGLADGGLIVNDSAITYLPVVVAIDRIDPRVELHITETA
jgi:Holliday junction resolvase RusA-like endonuclease